MSSLDPRIVESLRSAYERRTSRGELLSTDRLQASYAAFRVRFGPDALKSLDGPALLQVMHAHGNRESLVYWLEFKNDDEFPGQMFGSIAGGSAHKFGLFRRRETDQCPFSVARGSYLQPSFVRLFDHPIRPQVAQVPHMDAIKGRKLSL
jgi:hypothetical protein